MIMTVFNRLMNRSLTNSIDDETNKLSNGTIPHNSSVEYNRRQKSNESSEVIKSILNKTIYVYIYFYFIANDR
jgi:hypothetical protein